MNRLLNFHMYAMIHICLHLHAHTNRHTYTHTHAHNTQNKCINKNKFGYYRLEAFEPVNCIGSAITTAGSGTELISTGVVLFDICVGGCQMID